MNINQSFNKILISTMPRSGTVFIFDFIAALFGFSKLEPKFTGGFRPTPPEWDPYQFDSTYNDLNKYQVICAHYHLNEDIRTLLKGNDFLGIYLYRDPRDMIVSSTLYIKYKLDHHFLHPLFKSLSEEDAITFFIKGGRLPIKQLSYEVETNGADHVCFEGVKYFCEYAFPWSEHPKVVKIKYEDFTTDILTIGKAMAAVGININSERIEKTAQEFSFEQYSGGRSRGQEDKTAHFRSGSTGDYQKYFTPAHVRLCKEIIGDDLIKMGYENNLNW